MTGANARFWRNVALIGTIHAVAIYGLIRWSHETKAATSQSIVWMNGGLEEGAAPAATPVRPPKPMKASTPLPQPILPKKEETKEEGEQPVLTSAPSEIQLPVPKASPVATVTPRPKVTPTPVVKTTPPKRKPKPSPKPTPKPSPKTEKALLAKASPKPSPKIKPTPASEEKKAEEQEKGIEMAKAVLDKATIPEEEATPATVAVAPAGNGKTASTGKGRGHAGGGSGASQFGWYGSMLHDRFYSEWVQPAANLGSGAKISTLVRIRIEKDGRVSRFEIIKPSGDAAVDESVNAVAKSVTQVDPLPSGLGNGDHYDVKINFELNSEQ